MNAIVILAALSVGQIGGAAKTGTIADGYGGEIGVFYDLKGNISGFYPAGTRVLWPPGTYANAIAAQPAKKDAPLVASRNSRPSQAARRKALSSAHTMAARRRLPS